MTLWRLASLSLLVACARSFVLPPASTASTSQQVASRTAPARRSECCHARPRTAAIPASDTQPASRRAALGHLDAGTEANNDVGVDGNDGWDGNLDALDAQLRRQPAAAHVKVSAAQEFDDGFGALDDLLGLDDSFSNWAPLPPTSRRSGVDIDPFAKTESPVTTDSLFNLMAELPPPAAVAHTPSNRQGARAESTPPGASSGVEVSESWLNGRLNVSSATMHSPSASGLLESLIGDGPRGAAAAAAAAANTPPVAVGIATSTRNSADTPAALDDWLNELLEGIEDASRSKPAVAPMPPFQQQSRIGDTATPPGATASLEQDPWNFAADGGGGDAGGGSGDVISGSSELEFWKATPTDAYVTKRSNIMGRSRGAGAGRGVPGGAATAVSADATNGKSQSWAKESGFGEAEAGRSSDWGAGDEWTKTWRNSVLLRDQDGRGTGVEETTGRYGDSEGKHPLSPIQKAQRACVADIQKLGRRGKWEDATRALVGARVRGVPIDTYMYNSAINAVSKAGRWKEALSMMTQMEKDGLAFTLVTYTSAITACGKGGQPRRALELLDEMVKIHGLAPDVKCYGAAIQACVDAGMAEEAMSLMARMSGDGLKADNPAYNSAISACGESGQWEKALELLGEMRNADLTPDKASYRSAMKACGAGGRWERAVLLLHEMEEDGFTPDADVFQAALEVLKDAAQWERAIHLITEEMDELGVKPTEACFSAAIGACAEVGEWQQAYTLLKRMGLYGVQPELDTYKSCIKACLVGKEFDMALNTFFDLQKSGRRADQETWDMLIELCAVLGRWDAALEIIRDIFAEEVWFDMTAIRSRFFDCPAEDIKMKALTIIAMEARAAPSMKRAKSNNIRAALKRRKPDFKRRRKSA